MPTSNARTAQLLLLLLAASMLASCQGNSSSLPTGAARVVVRPLLPDPSIARISVTISPGTSGPAFSPIVADLAPSGDQWIGRITALPVGRQQQFDVIAFDARGNALYAAFASADVVASADAIVSISLDDRAPDYRSSFPVIDSVSWSPDPPPPGSLVQLRVTAHDPDRAQKLTYRWTADCGTFDDPASAAPRWKAPPSTSTCHLSVAVTDGVGATVGFDFSIQVVSTVGDASVVVTVNSWPVISSLSGVLSVRNTTMDGDLVVQASDPDGDTLSYTWESNCSGIVFNLTAPYRPTAPHITLPLASAPCTVIVSIYDGVSPRPTTGTFFVSPEVVRLNCVNIVCPAGQSCDLNDGLCKPCTANCSGRACGSDTCGGSCGTCPAGQACSSTYQCISVCVPQCAGKNCGPDGCGFQCGSCAAGMTCSPAGVCTGTCTPSCPANTCGPDGCGGTCACPAGTACGAGNQCAAACTPACSGKQCGPNGCGGTCGTCTSGSCSANGLCVCSPSCPANTCGPDGCGGTCACPAGTTCGAGNQCAAACTPACSGKQCGPNGCGGSCGACSSGTCTASGQCASTAPAVTPVIARDLPIGLPAFLAMDPAGNTVVAGTVANLLSTNFQTDPSKAPIPISSQNTSSDIFLARYDASGNIAWGQTIGDDDPTQTTDQYVSAAGLTNDGKVAFGGRLTGAVTVGAGPTIIGAGGSFVGYLAAVSSVDGKQSWGRGFDLGSNGLLTAVATNPASTQNRIALCGSASKAATQLVPGTTYSGGQTVDLVVAVFDSSGAKLWALQLGGSLNEQCTAIAIDDNGDVFAAGQYDGASLSFCPSGPSSNGQACSGTPIVLTGPGTTARKFMWVAKFNGSTGATLAATSFNGAVGAINPLAIAVSPTKDVFVGGSFLDATIGAPLPHQNGEDAFLAKLSGTTLAPVWNGLAWGGTGADRVTGLATTAAGDVLATGYVSPSSAAFRAANGHDVIGAVSLDVSGTSNPDVFVVGFDGLTGALQHGVTYGDPSNQQGLSIACSRSSAGQVTFSASVSGSATFGSGGTISAGTNTDIGLVFSKLQ